MRIRAPLSMASAVTSAKQGFNAASIALLPPIPLYRRILRTHRKHLSREMRLLGDEYVKSEFRSHRNVENPVHIIGFLTEWQMYAQKLEGNDWLGEKMDPAKIQKMSANLRFKAYTPFDQQLGQMYELMQAIRDKQKDENLEK